MFLLATLDFPNLWHSALPPTKSHPRHQRMTPKRMSTATGRVYSWKKPMRTSVWYGFGIFGMALVWPLLGILFTGKRRKYRSFRLLCCYLKKNWGDLQWFRVEKKKKPGPIRGFAHSPGFSAASCLSIIVINGLTIQLPKKSGNMPRMPFPTQRKFERFLKWLWIKTSPLQWTGCLFRHSIWNNRYWPIPHVE